MKVISNLTCFALIAILQGCNGINQDPYSNTPTTGKITIAVDETFKPVIEAELMAFEGLYRYSEIAPVYLPGDECFHLLMTDSVNLAITSRMLAGTEKETLRSRQLFPREIKIATDAISLIVNPANPDSVLSMVQVKDILFGKITDWDQLGDHSFQGNIQVIFDHKNSSIVRYLLDSLVQSGSLSQSLFALDSVPDVVDYISRNIYALGFIGVSWISDSDDSTQMSFLDKIGVVAISGNPKTIDQDSYLPYQAYIYQGSYPLIREIYAINTEPRNGLATGFMSFLASDKGQRIILKAGIAPAVAPVRIVKVRNEF